MGQSNWVGEEENRIGMTEITETDIQACEIECGSRRAIARILYELANRKTPADLFEDEKPILRAAAGLLKKGW